MILVFLGISNGVFGGMLDKIPHTLFVQQLTKVSFIIFWEKKLKMKRGKITSYFQTKKIDKSQGTRVVRLRRKAGKVTQGCNVYIGRACFRGGWKLKKSKWANPFSVRSCGSHENACKKYERYILNKPKLLNDLDELVGKSLGCWCKPNACHGDVLVKLIENGYHNDF